MAEGPAEEIRRAEDGELLGYVRALPEGTGWAAMAVFGGTLGVRSTRRDAAALVESDGLASLARRWFWRAADTADWEVVVIQEAWPGRAVGVVGLYALPGAPAFAISVDDLTAGAEMTLEPPDDADVGEYLARG